MLGQEPGRLLPAGGSIGAVVEAGEAEQLVGAVPVADEVPTDGLLMGGPGQAVDQLDVAAELRPAGEAVVAGQGELGIRQFELGRPRRPGRQLGQPRVVLPDQHAGLLEAAPDEVPKDLGVVLQLLDVRVLGQGIDGHGGLLSTGPGVRTVGQEGDVAAMDHRTRWALPLPADRRRSWIAGDDTTARWGGGRPMSSRSPPRLSGRMSASRPSAPPSISEGGKVFARHGAWCHDRRRIVLGLWVAVLVLGSAASGVVGGAFRDEFNLPDVESRTGFDILDDEFSDR